MNQGPFDITPPGGHPPASGPPDGQEFDQLEATELYCPRCKTAVPVRKFLLLVLPEGDKYEYRCQYCGTPVGDKMDRSGDFYDVFRR
jgi:DNA-directed RNA polymerase subunit RPC12/RpoP